MQSTPVNPVAIANTILDLAKSEGCDITPMQAIKLAYISHGWHLAITGLPLSRELAQAWQYGPVFPSVYRAFKAFGDGPITSHPRHVGTVHNAKSADIVREVWNSYKQYDGIAMSAMTHKPNTPWHHVWTKHARDGLIRNFPIPNSMIQEHYLELARKSREPGAKPS